MSEVKSFAMKSPRVYELSNQVWSPLRSDLTKNITNFPLYSEKGQKFKISIAKANSTGEFSIHSDSYDHIFFCIKGKGLFQIDDVTYEIKEESVIEVPAGTPHRYENNGDDELLLLTVNIYK